MMWRAAGQCGTKPILLPRVAELGNEAPLVGGKTMAKAVFRKLVYDIVKPALEPYGFSAKKIQSAVAFERKHRGYDNAMLITSGEAVPLTKALGFDLYAPKKPRGLSSMHFGDGRRWWYYETEDQLRSALIEIAALVVNEGLRWLDTYTPAMYRPGRT